MRSCDRQRLCGCAIVLVLAAGCGRAPALADAPPQAASGGHGHHAAAPVAAADAGSAAPRINTAPAPAPAAEGMVWVPGGVFWMGGASDAMPDALPAHLVEVDGFWMDRTPVTNAQFERFVKTTGYVTVAERTPSPSDYPGVPPDKLVAGSAVFTPTGHPVPLNDPLRWWTYARGASWRAPSGRGSSIRDRADHPVVHVAYEDAVAYARWAGGRLPTEAEFEFAARGGLDRNLYAWGNDLRPSGKPAANTWQGTFPVRDDARDGYAGTSPVRAFPPNGFGLYDMGGNVWQWCADWYRPDTYATRSATAGPIANPRGPESSHDPQEPGAATRVVRGGSYLCTEQYCARYLVGSRGKSEVSSGASNLGFRLVRSLRASAAAP
jgi:formylglycine-generating enzyme